MTNAAVFPGQGSQKVGMLNELSEVYPLVGETFEAASGVLGYDLWKLVQDGPTEELTKTQNTQPALLTASVALAMVAGFLSLIPGGLGVREMVILSLLAPYGGTVALVSAVMLRLAWLLTEVLCAIILYIGRWIPFDRDHSTRHL